MSSSYVISSGNTIQTSLTESSPNLVDVLIQNLTTVTAQECNNNTSLNGFNLTTIENGSRTVCLFTKKSQNSSHSDLSVTPSTNATKKVEQLSRGPSSMDLLDFVKTANTDSTTDIDPSNLDITAKLFLPANILSPAQALEKIKSSLSTFSKFVFSDNGETGVPVINTLILSFGGLSFSEEEDDDDDSDDEEDKEEKALKKNKLSDDDLFEIWKSTIDFATSLGISKEFGVAEFSSARLKALLNNIEEHISTEKDKYRVAVDHINASDCCALPPDLLQISKAHSIKLLAHHDPENLLPKPDFEKLSKYVSESGSEIADNWAWIMKVTAFIKDRQILKGNEYLVAIDTN